MTILCLRRSGPSAGIRPSVIAAASSPVRITTRDRWATRLADLGDQQLGGRSRPAPARSSAIALTNAGSMLRGRLAQHAGPDLPVDDQQVDPVAGPGGQRRQQQRGVHRVVELGLVADPAGGGAAGVEHDQHVPVPLRPPGPDHDRGRPGGAPPVDRPDVVAGHVLAQAVELRALAALQDASTGRRARAAGPAGWAGACGRGTAAARGRSTARLCSACRPATRSGPSARITTGPARRSPRRVGQQGQATAAAAAGPGWSPAATPPRAPADGVQALRTVAGQVAAAGLVSISSGLRLLAQPDRGVAGPRGPADLGRRRARATMSAAITATSTPVAISTAHQRAGDRHGDHRDRPASSRPARQVRIIASQLSAADQDQRGTGTVARMDSITESVVTPSSSASGRRRPGAAGSGRPAP